MVAFSQTIYVYKFSWMGFDLNVNEICSRVLNEQQAPNFYDNCLAPNRQKASIWTNFDLFHDMYMRNWALRR